jgi:hypothetical protein
VANPSPKRGAWASIVAFKWRFVFSKSGSFGGLLPFEKKTHAQGFFLVKYPFGRYSLAVTTLAEIKSAAESLSAQEQQQLMLFLVARLKDRGEIASPPSLSREVKTDWMAEDEAAMRRFHPNA